MNEAAGAAFGLLLAARFAFAADPPVTAPPATAPRAGEPGLPPIGDSTAPIQPIPQPGSAPAPSPAPPAGPQTGPAPPAGPRSTSGVPLSSLNPPATTAAPIGPNPKIAPNSRADVHADWGVYLPETNDLTARGHVVLTYRGVVLDSDEMQANFDSGDVEMQGNVAIRSDNRTVQGEALSFNLRTHAWKLGSGRAAFLPRGMLSPVFLQGVDITGKPQLIEGGPGSFTTCDLQPPHYHIEGRHLAILPEKRAVIDDAKLYFGRHHLLTVRRLVIPLGAHKYNIVPEVGENNLEGYYVKTAYHYPTSGGEVGTARVDLMSKRGIGIGVDQGYRLGAGGTGQVVLYSVLGGAALQGNELTGSLKHNQKLGSYKVHIQTDFRRNSYQFTPGSTSLNSDLGFNRTSKHSSTTFDFRTDQTTGSFGNSTQQTTSLGQSENWGATSAKLNLDLSDSRSAQSTEQDLNSQFTLDRRLPEYDLGFAYNRRDTLQSSTPIPFSSLDRLPEVTFGTDRHRIKGGLLSYLPGSFGLSVGEFHEDPGNVRSLRVLLDLGMDARTYKWGKSALTVSGSFKQMVYSSTAAQYIPNVNANWKMPVSKHNQVSMNYLLTDPKGYTPFQFDSVGRYNVLTADYVHKEKQFQASVGSGRDFRGGQFAWQDTRVQLRYTPSKAFQLGASSAYDLNQGMWRDVVSNSRLVFRGGFLDLGVRYSTQTHKLGTLKWNLFTPLGQRYSVQTFAGWNGFTNQYDYQVLRFNYEHHDFRASISYVQQTGYRMESGIQLSIQLRAFPMTEETATGQFGQALDSTDVGEVF